MFVRDQACLLRREPSGERHVLMVCFLRGHGLQYVLARASRSQPGAQPDLFSTGEILYQRKDADGPAFLREFSTAWEYRQIGAAYGRLQAAARLARFYERNLVHMETFGEAWRLLHAALAALAGKPHPEATLFKTWFLFARNEGYPVVAHWLRHKPPAEQAEITAVLRRPVEEAGADSHGLSRWNRDILDFFTRETDLLPPDL
jgi:hypothetical protein